MLRDARLGLRTAVGSRRATGAALVAFGLVGIVIVAFGLAALERFDPAREPASGADPVTELRLTLRASEAALQDAAASSRSAGAGLDEAAAAAGSAGTLTTDLATTMRGLAATLRMTIFGAQPFAAVAPAFDAVADRATVLATDLARVRTTVSAGADDLDALAGRLAELGDRVDRLHGSVDAATFEGLDSVRLFAAALLAWLAIPALASVWLGIQRLRLESDAGLGDAVSPRATSNG